MHSVFVLKQGYAVSPTKQWRTTFPVRSSSSAWASSCPCPPQPSVSWSPFPPPQIARPMLL